MVTKKFYDQPLKIEVAQPLMDHNQNKKPPRQQELINRMMA
jgi:hypothetical protein